MAQRAGIDEDGTPSIGELPCPFDGDMRVGTAGDHHGWKRQRPQCHGRESGDGRIGQGRLGIPIGRRNEEGTCDPVGRSLLRPSCE